MEKLLEIDPTKEVLKFYKEENEKATRHVLQFMQMSVQQPTEHDQRLTPVNSAQYAYGYMALSPQHTFGYIESRGLHQVQGETDPSVRNSSPTFFGL